MVLFAASCTTFVTPNCSRMHVVRNASVANSTLAGANVACPQTVSEACRADAYLPTPHDAATRSVKFYSREVPSFPRGRAAGREALYTGGARKNNRSAVLYRNYCPNHILPARSFLINSPDQHVSVRNLDRMRESNSEKLPNRSTTDIVRVCHMAKMAEKAFSKTGQSCQPRYHT